MHHEIELDFYSDISCSCIEQNSAHSARGSAEVGRAAGAGLLDAGDAETGGLVGLGPEDARRLVATRLGSPLRQLGILGFAIVRGAHPQKNVPNSVDCKA